MKAEMIELVMPGDTNPMGTAFGGKIMAWIDMVAAIAAQRAVGMVVTASVDSIEFKAPIKVGDVVILKAAVNKAWNTSLEVGVQVTFQSPRRQIGEAHVGDTGKQAAFDTYHDLGEPTQACRAYLTFVAVGDNGKRRKFSELKLLEGEDWERRAEEAEYRRHNRLAHRKDKEWQTERFTSTKKNGSTE